MIYLIRNVMDSCENIQGLTYRIILMENSVRENPIKVRDENDGPDPRVKNIAVINAKYDCKFYHESAMAACFDFIRINATENKFTDISIQFNPDYLTQ